MQQNRGKLIRQKRLEAGLSQQELADLIGLKKSTISRYENNQINRINKDIAVALGEILDLDFKELLQKEEPEDSDFGSYMDSSGLFLEHDLLEVPEEPKVSLDLYKDVKSFLDRSPSRSIKLKDCLNPAEHFVIKGSDFFDKPGLKRKNLVFQKDFALKDGKSQLILLGDKVWFGKIRIYKDIAVIKTELKEPDDLIFLDLKDNAYKVLGTFLKMNGH